MNNDTKHEAQGLEVAQQSAPAGYVMVPVEPNEALLDAMWNNVQLEPTDNQLKVLYKAILAAASKAEPTADNVDQLGLLALVITSHEEKHGGLRAAAKALGIDPAYLYRLKSGEKTSPSAEVLAALGLERHSYYRPLLAAAPKAEQPPVQGPIGETCRGHSAGVIFYTWLPYPKDGTKLYAAPQPVSDDVANGALVEALERLQNAAYNIGGEHVSGWQPLLDAADDAGDALAAYRAAMGSKGDE